MINNVLSIDCDIAFECDEYAKYMNYDLEPELAWEVVELIAKRKNVNIDINIDALKSIIWAFKRCTRAKFRLIEEHDHIIEIMKSYNCQQSTVYNYDHHHDITYGNDDNELNIENWVRFGKKLGLIGDYHWINRPMSDIRFESLFKYYRTCLDDVNIDNMNEIDLVVICISKHFTPRKYWDSLPNTLLSYKDINGWQEVTPNTLPYDKIQNMDTYLIDGTMPNVDRLFRKDNGYVVLEDKNISMFSLDKKIDIFTIKSVVDYLLDDYNELIVDYIVGSKNEIYINRLLRNYKIISDITNNNVRQIKFNRSDI
ncbi:MAG: hypothetical protein ACRCX2_14980 [Paraclostridium sp.]